MTAEEDGGEGNEKGSGEGEEEGDGGGEEEEEAPGGEDPEGHVGGGGEIDPGGEAVLVVEEVHGAEGGHGTGDVAAVIEGAEEEDGGEIEREDEGGDEERGGDEGDGSEGGEGAGGEQALEEEDGGDGEEDVGGGAGVDERGKVGHVGEAIHAVQVFFGAVGWAVVGLVGAEGCRHGGSGIGSGWAPLEFTVDVRSSFKEARGPRWKSGMREFFTSSSLGSE